MLFLIQFLVELIYKMYINIKKKKKFYFILCSFYSVKNINFDYKNYLADIELQTIVKKEILEEKIRIEKKVIYDKNANLVRIDE